MDNGSEYGWQSWLRGVKVLSGLVREKRTDELRVFGNVPDDIRQYAITRALPYESQSKPAEGFFSNFENKYLTSMRGYVGGDRMQQKTHNRGQTPLAHGSDWEQFHDTLNKFLASYHAMPQKSGCMKGFSPNSKYQSFIDNEWKAWRVDEQTLTFCFATPDSRVVTAGRFSWNDEPYFSDELLGIKNQRLNLYVPEWDERWLFVQHPDGRLIKTGLEKDHRFHWIDGAKEKSRRKKMLNAKVSKLKSHCNRLELDDVAQDWALAQPPTPETPFYDEEIQVEDAAQLMADLMTSEAGTTSETTDSNPDLGSLWLSDEESAELTRKYSELED